MPYDLSGLDSGYYQKSGMGDTFKKITEGFKELHVVAKVLVVIAIVALVLIVLAFAGVPLLPRWMSREGLTTP